MGAKKFINQNQSDSIGQDRTLTILDSTDDVSGKSQILLELARQLCELKLTTESNLIKMGSLLTKAKEMLPKGEYYRWISANTGISKSTANNLVLIYKRFGDDQSVVKLQALGGYAKAVSLLSLPDEKIKKLIDTCDVKNMTTRELKQYVRVSKRRDAADSDSKMGNGSHTSKNAEVKIVFSQDDLVDGLLRMQLAEKILIALKELVSKHVGDSTPAEDGPQLSCTVSIELQYMPDIPVSDMDTAHDDYGIAKEFERLRRDCPELWNTTIDFSDIDCEEREAGQQ